MGEKTTVMDIGEGTAAVLVYDPNLRNYHSEFYQWLRAEGYAVWEYSPSEAPGWIYININSKVYSHGKQGISITREFGKHAIGIDEFKTIHEIYKKYEGKKPLDFD